MHLLHLFPVADDVDGDLRGDEPQGVHVEVDDLAHLDDIFFAELSAGRVFDDGHLTLELVELQIVVEFHAAAGGDMVDNETVYDSAYDHVSPPPEVSE